VVESSGALRTYTYKAFISYSHAADGRLAPALQHALHGFARPWYRLRAIRVFRDTSNLAASPHLWSSIESALGESEYFLLLASPEAAKSKWVTRELETFLQNNPSEKILLVLTEGELAWDPVTNDFDRSRTTAFPRLGRKIFAEEPLWVDLRDASSAEKLDTANPDFKGAVARLSSALRAIPLDEIVGQDVQQHKRAMRLLWSGIASLSILLSRRSSFGLDAQRQRDRAVQQMRIATLRSLVTEAKNSISNHPDLALIMAAEAAERANVWEARDALLSTLQNAAGVKTFLTGHTSYVASAVFSPDGKILASASGDKTIRLWDVASRQALGAPLTGHTSMVTSVAFSPNGKTLASAGWDKTVRGCGMWPPAKRWGRR
jgi:WD40 repeat protein